MTDDKMVERLQNLAEVARADLGDGLTNQEGQNLREPGKIEVND